MHIDPILPRLVAVVLVVLCLGLVLKTLRQPHVVGYLLAGVVLGPHALAVVSDVELIGHFGSVGVVLLLFFIGMEISPTRLLASWRVAVLGTLAQIAISVACVWGIGAGLGWSPARSVLLGFVISLSSTAVVLKLLKDRGEIDSRVGQDVLGVLLVQDLAIVPMLLVLGLMSGVGADLPTLGLQIVGGAAAVAFAARLVSGPPVRLPFAKLIGDDREMQVFAAAVIAMGLSLLTALCGLSTALGAFLAGLLVASTRETDWVHRALDPFRVVFIAVFFVSIGMLIDLSFLNEHWPKLLLLVGAVFVTNHLVNTLVLRALGCEWRDSLYAGSLLSQIGEFSFVLASVGLQLGLVTTYGYQATVAVIALTLLLSPAWIAVTRKLIGGRAGTLAASVPAP